MIIPIKHSAKQAKIPPAFSLPTSESEGAFGPPACILQGEVPTKNDLYKIARSLGLFTQVANWHVYVLKCKVAGHWYVGQTNNPGRRLVQHVDGSGAWFTKAYGVDCLWSLFEVLTLHQAKYLEIQACGILKKAYPTQCFSIGNACRCTNYSWEISL
jgi:predicted GIY-YIG superfamily endonuclease